MSLLPQMQQSLEVMAVGSVRVVQHFIPLLRRNAMIFRSPSNTNCSALAKGLCDFYKLSSPPLSHPCRIVNVSSGAGFIPISLNGPYSMAKFALEAATDVLRVGNCIFAISRLLICYLSKKLLRWEYGLTAYSPI